MIDWIMKYWPKPVTKLPGRTELRTKQLRLGIERSRMMKQVEGLAKDKEIIFSKGQKSSQEVRRALAQDFEIKTAEQLMVGRQLNVTGKEHLLISRMLMLVKNKQQYKIDPATLVALTVAMENEAVSSAAYQERLDMAMEVGTIDEGTTGLSESSQRVLNIWNRMDNNEVSSTDAFTLADSEVRELQDAELSAE